MNSNFKFQISNFVLDLFFPKFCLGCQREGTFLCEDCKATLEILEYDYCLCEKNPHLIPPDRQGPGKCPRCQDKKLSGLYFAISYKKPLAKTLIHQFKYQPYTKKLAKPLASLLIEHFILTKKNADEIWENSVLAPVPLFYKKLKDRGYNQSEELAKELAKVLKIPVVLNVLIKTKPTKPQMKLKKEAREKNLQGVFGVCPRADLGQTPFTGKKVFLVDDVYTTGATLNECAAVLRDGGAKSVWGICIARGE